MKEIVSTEAIVLQKRKTGEGDLIFELLCSDGSMLNLKNHNIRKARRRSQLAWSIGNKLHIQFYPRQTGLVSLKEARLIEDRSQPEIGWQQLQQLSYIVELAGITRIQNNPTGLYLLLDGALSQFSKYLSIIQIQKQKDADKTDYSFHISLLLFFYKARLLKLWGLLGDTRHCTICGSELMEKVHWQFPECSFTCQQCADNATSEEWLFVLILRLMRENRFTNVLDSELLNKETGNPDLKQILIDFDQRLHLSIMHFIGKPLKSAKGLYG